MNEAWKCLLDIVKAHAYPLHRPGQPRQAYFVIDHEDACKPLTNQQARQAEQALSVLWAYFNNVTPRHWTDEDAGQAKEEVADAQQALVRLAELESERKKEGRKTPETASESDALKGIQSGEQQQINNRWDLLCKVLQCFRVYLVTMVAVDEREQDDGCFAFYYVYSHPAIELSPPTFEKVAQLDADGLPPDDYFLMVKYLLAPSKGATGRNQPQPYLSIRKYFEGAIPFEREALDLLGIKPEPTTTSEDPSKEVHQGTLLHDSFRPGWHPLRADVKYCDELQGPVSQEDTAGASSDDRYANMLKRAAAEIVGRNDLKPSQAETWVGPIHAGVIESGQFRFRGTGEAPEGIKVRLGFKHKGIEKLFETAYIPNGAANQRNNQSANKGIEFPPYNLRNGWTLAERVCGDSSFAHSLAYCHAVETLMGFSVSDRQTYLRGLFLELERIYNHIGTTAALAKDVALHKQAADLSALRERLLQLNSTLLGGSNGARFLRGLNQPGGLNLKDVLYPIGLKRTQGQEPESVQALIDQTVESITLEGPRRSRFNSFDQLLINYGALASRLLDTPSFRARAVDIGVFCRGIVSPEVTKIGATGFVARSAGVLRDFRLQHPSGVYRDSDVKIRTKLREHVASAWNGNVRLQSDQFTGDVYSRLLLRVREVESSRRIIGELLNKLESLDTEDEPLLNDDRWNPDNDQTYPFALGYAEGWRGEIIYWVMRDHDRGIYRCKVRDPSQLNWRALELAVTSGSSRESQSSDTKRLDSHQDGIPRQPAPPQPSLASILADFPLINKSFDLSYSAYDG